MSRLKLFALTALLSGAATLTAAGPAHAARQKQNGEGPCTTNAECSSNSCCASANFGNGVCGQCPGTTCTADKICASQSCNEDLRRCCDVPVCSSGCIGDTQNCGACGTACTANPANSTAFCSMGTCAFTCNPGYILCDNKCVPFNQSPNCGACNSVCATGTSCLAVTSNGTTTAASYSCQCPNATDVYCDGFCRPPTSSYFFTSANCGTCGNNCGLSGACASYTIGTTSKTTCLCQWPNFSCNGQCVYAGDNCGGCGVKCGANSYCAGMQSGSWGLEYRCECNTGYKKCNGVCVDQTSYDSALCEPCPLAGQQRCRNPQSGVIECKDLMNDPENCGSCGSLCSTGLCNDGVCANNTCFSGSALPGGGTAVSVPLSATNQAACRLNTSSIAQGAFDNQTGEDQSFFIQEATSPSLVVLVDNGASMRKLPQDPGCGVIAPAGLNLGTEGCGTVDGTPDTIGWVKIINSFYKKGDAAKGGKLPPDLDYPTLFVPGTYYEGLQDSVFLDKGCDGFEVGHSPSTAQVICEQRLGLVTNIDKKNKCIMCLTNKGFYATADGRRAYDGSFLNTFPPKCLMARNLLKSAALLAQKKVRYSVGITQETAGTEGALMAESPVDFILSGFQPNQCPSSGGIENQCTVSVDTSKSPPINVRSAHCPSQYLSNVNNESKLTFDVGAKPLGEALFAAGQWVQDNAKFYGNQFGPNWVVNGYSNPELQQTMSAVCSSCQKTAIVLISDGAPCRDSALPYSMTATTDTLRQYDPIDPSTGDCTVDASGCKDTCDGKISWASAVSAMLANNDLRADYGDANSPPQTAQTFVIGLGADNRLLRSIAVRGNGDFFTAYNYRQLEQALNDVIAMVSARAVSVAVPSLSTLQTKAGSATIIPRFIPNKLAAWEGQLFKFDFFDEFAQGCIEAGVKLTAAGKVEEPRCLCLVDKKCNGKYITDTLNRTVGIDNEDGAMVVVQYDEKGNQTPVLENGAPIKASEIWEAGLRLKERFDSPTTLPERKIFTVIDRDLDGDIDATDGLTPVTFKYTTDADLDKLIPYLGLGTKYGESPRACEAIAARLAGRNIALTSFNERMCARIVIAWVRGHDVFNETGYVLNMTGYPENTPRRPYLLGDIFHSSPIRVDPPIDKQPLCDRGFHNQCLRSLYATAIPADAAPTCDLSETTRKGLDPYLMYRYQQTFDTAAGGKVGRSPFLLVGANDGMVHAFQVGCYTGQDDKTKQPKYDETGANITCASSKLRNGDELWAFIPPDLLPRLQEFLVGRRHPYMVDGTPMVRDVWVDGSATSTGLKNGKKGCDEFHTVAVLGERRGGTRYTALDVTDPTNPKFRWTFPGVGTPEEVTMGETWTEYLPGAPPIGPVKLLNSTGAVEERWVAMVSGGYDPRRIRGNQLYMLDVWSGEKIWEARYKAGTLTEAMQFPFPAMPAMVAWGPTASSANFDFNEGYFDSAVIGDIGGQVWVARFHEPGEFNDSPYFPGREKIVTNWQVARGFQEALEGTFLDRQPFFSLASTIRMPGSGGMRALIGTGDRYNLKQWDLGFCTLDDPLACARTGKLPFNTSTAAGPDVPPTEYVAGDDHLQVSWSMDATSGYVRKEDLTWSTTGSCPMPADVLSTTKPVRLGTKMNIAEFLPSGSIAPAYVPDSSYLCSIAGNQNRSLRCDADPADRGYIDNGISTAADLESKISGQPFFFNRFIAFNVFQQGTRDIFKDEESAKVYDEARLTERHSDPLRELIWLDPYDKPDKYATEADNGWYFLFPGIDERTATNSTVFQNTALFSTVQASESCGGAEDVPCPDGRQCAGGACFHPRGQCSSGSSMLTSFLYQADAITGGLTSPLTSHVGRRTKSSVVLPPPPPQEIVEVNEFGKFKTSIAPPPGGKAPESSDATYDMMRSLYMNEIPRNVHECRHKDPSPGGANCR